MTHSPSAVSPMTVGLDAGDKRTHGCALDASRNVAARGSFPTSREELERAMAPFAGARIVLEAGSQSPWMSRVLRALGYQVRVADPRSVQLISKDRRKTDRRDAEKLAPMASAMPELLGNIHHRGEQAHAHLAIVRARDLLVRMRTMSVLQARGICKSFGLRLPKCTTQGAKRIIGPLGADCGLRRYGLRLAARGGGKIAKKKAAVAVACKLAVLLHRLWVSGKDYEALRGSNQSTAVVAV